MTRWEDEMEDDNNTFSAQSHSSNRNQVQQHVNNPQNMQPPITTHPSILHASSQVNRVPSPYIAPPLTPLTPQPLDRMLSSNSNNQNSRYGNHPNYAINNQYHSQYPPQSPLPPISPLMMQPQVSYRGESIDATSSVPSWQR